MDPTAVTTLLQTLAAIAWATAACLLLRSNRYGRQRADALLGGGMLVGAALQSFDTLGVRGAVGMPFMAWALLAAAAWWLLPQPGSGTWRASESSWRRIACALGTAAVLHALHVMTPVQPVLHHGLDWRPVELPTAILLAILALRARNHPHADCGRLGATPGSWLLLATALGCLASALSAPGSDVAVAVLQIVGITPFLRANVRSNAREVAILAAIASTAAGACLLRIGGLEHATAQRELALEQRQVSEQMLPDAALTTSLADIARTATEPTPENALELARLFGERAASAESRITIARHAANGWATSTETAAATTDQLAQLLGGLAVLFATLGLTLRSRPREPAPLPHPATTIAATVPHPAGAAPVLVPLDSVLARVGHELRTPLTTMLGAAELLAEQPDDQQREAHVRTITVHGRRLATVLAQVQDLERLCRGDLALAKETYAFDRLLRDAVAAAQPAATEKGVAIRVELPEGLPRWLHGDPQCLRQIVDALLDQAVECTRIGSVDVHVRSEGNQLTIAVLDEGPGIAADQVETFFDGFYAVAPTDTPTAHLGLSIALAKRLALAMDGDLTVHARVGHGSEFRVDLPLRPAEAWEVELEEQAAGATSATTPASKPVRLRGRVLLVEDSRDHQIVLCRMLQKAGVDVALAENGIVALHLLEHDAFDLVLMDMQMPEMDGLTAVKKMRARDDQTPVVALTADALSGDAERCMAAGCNGHLAKPTDRATLAATLAMFLPQRVAAN